MPKTYRREYGDGADAIAERHRALHSTADGRVAVVAASTSLPEFPAGEVLTHDAIDVVVAAIDTAVGTIREVHDDVDAEDPTSADLLHESIAKLGQQSWFISAETRRPAG